MYECFECKNSCDAPVGDYLCIKCGGRMVLQEDANKEHTLLHKAISRLQQLETHLINAIIKFQDVEKYPQSILDKMVKVSDSMEKKYKDAVQALNISFSEQTKYLNTLNLSQAFNEIKYIGNRLKSIEDRLTSIELSGIKKDLKISINLDEKQISPAIEDVYHVEGKLEKQGENNLSSFIEKMPGRMKDFIKCIVICAIDDRGEYSQKKIANMMGFTASRAHQYEQKLKRMLNMGRPTFLKWREEVKNPHIITIIERIIK